MTVKTLWVLALYMTVCAGAIAHPPAGADPDSPEAKWYQGAYTPECSGCCSIADGYPVVAIPDPYSPMGWDVEIHPGVVVPVPAGTRATKCTDFWGKGGTPIGPYDPHPAGTAIIWVYPTDDTIRCFSPPEAGG